MFYFNERGTKRKTFYVEKCRGCGGDEMDEKNLFSKRHLFFKNLKTKFNTWRQKRRRS